MTIWQMGLTAVYLFYAYLVISEHGFWFFFWAWLLGGIWVQGSRMGWINAGNALGLFFMLFLCWCEFGSIWIGIAILTGVITLIYRVLAGAERTAKHTKKHIIIYKEK